MKKMERSVYLDRLRGAFLCRAAGCTLGAPVEGWSSAKMKEYAEETGVEFPPADYWDSVPNPDEPRYLVEKFKNYTKPYLDGIPCDDDVGYTLLSLLIAEEAKNYPAITLDDVAKCWKKYITLAWTAEEVALSNLKKGIPPSKAAEADNPYDEWIGADIRCDGYAYMNPCNPAVAADMAEVDALISHRGEGVYGSRYFAAAISLAFLHGNTKTALTEALEYIPDSSRLHDCISWALGLWGKVSDPLEASRLVDERYPDMHPVHTINNAALTVFALSIGGADGGKVIANAVAMAHDCDCTAATAGSLAGAAYGTKCLAPHWYSCFGDSLRSYFNGDREYSIEDILNRFCKKAERFLI